MSPSREEVPETFMDSKTYLDSTPARYYPDPADLVNDCSNCEYRGDTCRGQCDEVHELRPIWEICPQLFRNK